MEEVEELQPIFEKLKDFRGLLGTIPDSIWNYIDDIFNDMEYDPDEDPEEYEDTSGLVGGLFYLIEEEDGLKQVDTMTAGSDNKWMSLYEVPCDCYEVVESIGEKDENGIGEYIVIVHIFNNAGGHTYFIDRSIYYKSESLRVTYDMFMEDACK